MARVPVNRRHNHEIECVYPYMKKRGCDGGPVKHRFPQARKPAVRGGHLTSVSAAGTAASFIAHDFSNFDEFAISWFMPIRGSL